MGISELDHIPEIARGELQEEIHRVGDTIINQAEAWIEFVTANPEAGYVTSQTPSTQAGVCTSYCHLRS
jgi:hypothetical protein